VQFLQNLPFYGAAILCDDDARARRSCRWCPSRCVTYGTSDDCSVRADAIAHDGGRMRFRARAAPGSARRGAEPARAATTCSTRSPTIAVADELGVQDAGDPQGAGRVPPASAAASSATAK
jgi:UDP-N-acetylmuramate--alanine ligase